MDSGQSIKSCGVPTGDDLAAMDAGSRANIDKQSQLTRMASSSFLPRYTVLPKSLSLVSVCNSGASYLSWCKPNGCARQECT